MYNASDNYRNLIDNNIRGSWGAIITRGTDTISDDAIKSINKYEQYMTSLSFGNIVSSYVTCEVYGIDLGYYNSSINVDITLEEEVVPLGQFTVFDRPTVINGVTKFVAYDNVKKLAKKYETSITYPATIQAVVSEIMTSCGTSITHITYPDIMITKAFELDTCAQVMSEICKLLGKNLVANRNGVLEYRWLNTTSLVVDASKHFSLNVSDAVSTLGILKCKKDADTELTSGATGDSLYLNSEYMTQAQLDSVLAENTVTYRYGNCDFVGDATLDCGDVITVKDINDVSYPFIVMSNSFSYDGGCKNIIESYDIEEETETISDAVTESKKESKKAQATANGKNTVYYSQPDSTDNIAENDIWFNADEDNCLYRWTGTKWEKKEIGSMAISYMDAAKVSCKDLSSIQATIGGFAMSTNGISQESNDGLNKVLFRPVQANKSYGVFHVMERTSKDAAWEYPVSINGDGSAKFTKLTVGGNSMLAGWRVTDDIIRKEIEIGGIKYQTCLQAADSVNTTNNIYVRHSSDGVGWDYDFSLNYLGKLTTNNINVTGGNINIAAKNIGQSYVSVYLKDATHDMKASLLPFCLSVIDSKEKFSTQLDSAGIDFKRSDGIKGQIKLDYDNLLRVSGITKFVDSIRFDNASGIQVKDTSGTYRRMLTIDADNGMRIASNGCTGALYIGNMSNSDTYLYGRQMLFNTRSTSGEDGTRIRLFREPNTGEGRTIFRPDVPNGAYQGSASYRWNTVFCGTLNQTSDLKLKNVIGEIAKAKEFIMGLKPIEYTFKQPDSSNPRTHMGFGAQPVKELVESIGMGDRALYQASVINEDGSESYYDETVDDSKLSWGLNYNEFIAPLVKVVQDQQKEIENLKEAIKKIEAA